MSRRSWFWMGVYILALVVGIAIGRVMFLLPDPWPVISIAVGVGIVALAVADWVRHLVQDHRRWTGRL